MSTDRGDSVHDAVSLARLALDADASALLVEECRRVIEAWRGLPADGFASVAPTHPAGLHDVLREDEPEPTLSAEDALSGAPDTARGAFRVPPVADVQ